MFRDGKGVAWRHLPALQLLEQKIKGHHLRERRGMAQGVGVACVKWAAGFSVDDKGGVLTRVG